MDRGNPAGQRNSLHVFKTRIGQAAGKGAAAWELANAFSQILIAVAVIRHKFANRGNDFERIGIVYFAQGRVVHVTNDGPLRRTNN